MGYTIYYKAMFLKLRNEKYLPMFEAASSNVWSVESPRKRSRDWGNTRFGGAPEKVCLTENELLNIPNIEEKKLIERYPNDYNKKSFGWSFGVAIGNKKTYNTTFNDYKNLFKAGIKNSITFDMLKEFNIKLHAFKFNLDNGYTTFKVETENDVLNLIETVPNVWFNFLNLNDEKFNYIRLVLLNKEKAKKTNKLDKFKVKTNLGFIIGFDDKYKPIFSDNEKDIMLFNKTEAKAMSFMLFRIGIQNLHSVSYIQTY